MAAFAVATDCMVGSKKQSELRPDAFAWYTAPAASEADMQRSLELSTGFQNLTGGFGSWRDVSLRGTYGLPSHVLQGELSVNRRFNKDGAFVGLSDTYTINDDW